MNSKEWFGVVRNGKIAILDGGEPLPEGSYVRIVPIAAEAGNGAAIVAALKASPPIPKEWVAELEQLIREGERPPSPLDPSLKAWEEECDEVAEMWQGEFDSVTDLRRIRDED